MYKRCFLACLAAALAWAPGGALAQQTGPRPSIAVLDFNTNGLTSNWYGSFQPGVALSDLLTDRMVNAGHFNVLDRTHLSSTLGEHQLGASGEVDPQSAITAGKMTGARYLVTGNILQLDQTGQSGANAGSFLPYPFSAAAGSVNTHKVTIKVAVRVIDARTGQIVQSFSDEETRSGTSWGAGGFTGGTWGSYSNEQFVNSDMGHLIDDEADKIVASIDPSRFNSGPVAATLTGHVAAIDGHNVIIDIGSNYGVQPGQQFDIVMTKSLVDPTTHQVLHVSENIGKLQIDTVSSNASVGHVISGRAAVRVTVTSSP
ncbi:MAG TPA: CsgG/HfaB family protein [Candidatus Binatia bacterium]|nr:CsgG/HfaB family protein [Candidatus Binatia bacterium]